MKLEEALKAVREDNLDKSQIEAYHLMLSGLYGDLKLDIASHKKEKAIFIAGRTEGESIASRKVAWESTKSGQRLIELEGYASATRVMIDSLKSRLYSIF